MIRTRYDIHNYITDITKVYCMNVLNVCPVANNMTINKETQFKGTYEYHKDNYF